MKSISILKHNLMRATLTLALIVTCATAWAETVETYYIDENGTRHDVTATVLTGSETSLGTSGQTTWYVVNSNINHTGQIWCNGNVILILADGKTMTADGDNSYAIWGNPNGTLTIYGQTLGTGTLNASSTGNDAIHHRENLIICGGTVNATTTGGMSRAIFALGTVTISSGTVNADGSSAFYGICGSIDVEISGGKVTANGGINGIWAQSGTIILGWTHATDYIHANSYNGTVTVAPGQTFLTDDDPAQQVSGNVTDLSLINGKTLTPDVSSSFTVSADGNTYTIWNAYGWNVFCDYIEGGESFSGKTVQLGADITISRIASTGDPYFRGTFDGQGHTLTLDYGTANDPIDAQFVAPFGEITWSTSPTFRNLNISGHIYEAYTGSEAHNIGGLIGHLFGNVTIVHCTSNVEITSTGGAGGFVGLCEHTVSFNDCLSSTVIHSAGGNNSGFVGWSRASNQPYNINFTGCVFNGKLLQINGNGNSNGGFIGWTGSTKIVSITNCLYAPAALADGETMASSNSATFARGWNTTTTATNSYYTEALGAAQGTQAYSITAGENVTVDYAGTPTNTYATSGITTYATGIKCNDVLYAGSGDEVSLTLNHSDLTGYIFSNYTVSAGQLTGSENSYTLTMPNENVTVSATFSQIPVTYLDMSGTALQCTNYTVLTGGGATTIGAGWYVVKDANVTYSDRITVSGGDVHLILADDASLTINSSYGAAIFYKGDGNLSIYGQDKGNGILVAKAGIGGDGISVMGNVTINGGCTTFRKGSTDLDGISVSIGKTISLNWTRPANSIYSDGYTGNSLTVKVAAGKTLHEGTNFYNGTLTSDQISALAGKTLYPYSDDAVPYLDINGQQRYCVEYTTLTGDETALAEDEETWYVAQPDTLDYSSKIDLVYNTHIILCDDAVMNVDVTGAAISPIYSGPSLSIYGQTGQSGELNVTSTNGNALYVYGDITIAGGKVTASGTNGITADGGKMTIKNATVTATGTDAYQGKGIRSYNGGITIDNSNVTATGTGNTGKAICSENGDIIIRNGGKTTANENNNVAIYAENGDITITGCEVEATGGKGIFADNSSNNGGGNVTIQNATVTATTTSTGYTGAIHSYNGDITINNSNVTASGTGRYGIYAEISGNILLNGGKITANGSGSGFGLICDAGNVTITGCEVEATGRIGIYANNSDNNGDDGNVTIQNATVTATGSYTAIHSYNGDITIDNSNVEATSTGRYGIYAEISGNILLNGGKITANGMANGMGFGLICDAGSVTIESGQVEITGGNFGILASNITLGWTNATDYIYVSRYMDNENDPITLAKTFIDEDGHTYSGTINKVNGAYPIDGKTLYPEGVIFKEVAGYGEGSGGWVFIASPVAGSIAPTEVHNLLGSYDETTEKYDYDLYRFNQSANLEWQNYHSHTDDFNLVNGQGYLYATKYTKKLAFGGTFNTSTTPVAVPLDYTANAQYAGWNLVGNPFTVAATMTDGQGQPKSYYVISGQTVVPYDGNATTIEPFTGVMVKAEGTGESVYFTKVSSNAAPQPNNGSLHIALTQVPEPVEGPTRNQTGVSTSSTTLLDNAIVSFNEGSQLGKFYFGEQNGNIYIPQGTEEYAIVSAGRDGVHTVSTMPINFKAKKNGEYTITVNPENVEMNYMHLIDNMTGADVDLLVEPNYTFNARTTDYESRFNLVFSTKDSGDADGDDEAPFAFINNGQIIIIDADSDACDASLQVIDVMGRICRDAMLASPNHRISTERMASGVYVLRLINGDVVRVQKIVIE